MFMSLIPVQKHIFQYLILLNIWVTTLYQMSYHNYSFMFSKKVDDSTSFFV